MSLSCPAYQHHPSYSASQISSAFIVFDVAKCTPQGHNKDNKATSPARAEHSRSFLSDSCSSGTCFTVLISNVISSRHRPYGAATKDSNNYKTPYASPQSSSKPFCRCTAGLYLVSLFSNGNLHQFCPPFAAIIYRASDLPKQLVDSGRSVRWTRFCNPPLDSVQPSTA